MDGDSTIELAEEALPPKEQLRRKDDLKKFQFRQKAAYYAMANLTIITLAMLFVEGDLGMNISQLLSWIITSQAAIICTVVGIKGWESITVLRNGKK